MSHFEELKFDCKTKNDVSLFGALPGSGAVDFYLRVSRKDIPREYAVTSVKMVIHADGMNMPKTEYRSYTFEALPDQPGEWRSFRLRLDCGALLRSFRLEDSGLFYYHYAVTFSNGEDGDEVVYLGGEAPTSLAVLENFVGERQLLLYREDYTTSKEFTEGIIYHVFVDRFRRSGRCGVKDDAVFDPDWENGIPQYGEYPGAEVENNVFFGGDLYGVAEKLDYIAALGTKTIYLSPVFDAHSNHKYDTGDYLTVDEMFGGDDALRELCEKAKARGINVILDGVFNHTGSDSVYFNKNGKYDSVGAYQSDESPYFPWYGFREYPDEYECWWGVKILPRVNSGNEDYRAFICDSVVNKWMKAGVSGWRLDVADELADEFLYSFREAVKENNPDGVIIGEVWEDASDKVAYGSRRNYLRGRQLDSVMNYPLRSAILNYVKDGSCADLRKYTEGTYRRYPKGTSDNLMNFLGTHDTERIITLLGGEPCGDHTNDELSVMKMTDDEKQAAAAKLKLAYGIIGGLPGVPCVFYGDEVGLEGYRDPFCRRPFPWHDMDGALLAHYRSIGGIRRKYPVFRDGLFRILSLTDKHFVYVRWSSEEDGDQIIVAASRSGEMNLNLPRITKDAATGEELGDTCTVGENETKYFICPAWVAVSAESLGIE